MPTWNVWTPHQKREARRKAKAKAKGGEGFKKKFRWRRFMKKMGYWR